MILAGTVAVVQNISVVDILLYYENKKTTSPLTPPQLGEGNESPSHDVFPLSIYFYITKNSLNNKRESACVLPSEASEGQGVRLKTRIYRKLITPLLISPSSNFPHCRQMIVTRHIIPSSPLRTYTRGVLSCSYR